MTLLSARSPKLTQALPKGREGGLHLLVLDGALIIADRVGADRPYYSAKHRCHGMNVQVIADPDGTILWICGDLPGSTHDLTAARFWGILHERANAQLESWRILSKLRSSPSKAGHLVKAAAVLQNHEAIRG